MIRAIRPNAMAQDDAAPAAGWNIAPNLAYVLVLLPGSSSCGVLLYDEDGSTLIATGAALVGTAQPCVLIPQAGQTVGMVDADLGWHLLLTTTGTESQRTIRLGPAVDLSDEIHPVYGDDDMALARATAAIDAAAHYIDDVTVSCPLGLGAGLGDVVSVPVDGVAVVGQVESITWTATPDGTTEQAVIRRHVAIAPDAFVEITPPTVADDTGTATHLVGTAGNVLANDESGLTVVAVNGLSANVGVAVDGDNGGSFTVNANGSWTFGPAGDFALLEGSETADTTVTYHASDGTSEAMATLTVTVSHANTAPVAAGDTGETTADATTSGNVLTNDTDADLDSLTVSQVAGSAANVGVAVAGSTGGLFTIGSDGAWSFDPDGAFAELEGEATATTSVTYHVSDGSAEDEGTLTVTVSAASAAPWTPADAPSSLWLDAADSSTITLDGSAVVEWRDKSGNGRHVSQGTPADRPQLASSPPRVVFDGSNDALISSAFNFPRPFSVFFVGSNASGGYRRAVHVGSSSDTNVFIGSTDGYYATFFGDGASTWVDVAANAPSKTVSTPRVFGVTNAGSGATDAVPYTDGVAQNAKGGGTFSGTGTGVSIGSQRPNGMQFWQGPIYEVLIFPRACDSTERQKIEGYLAHKWGLTANLPSDHPYKSAPPML